MRTEFLPFSQPDLDGTELAQVQETLASGWLTTGPKTAQFEAEFAEFVGCRHAVAVNSCTAAMHLALAGIGLQPGDEVITTPYTFAATAEVVRYFRAKPVFVDILATDFNLDPFLVETAVTPRTKAILPVHIAGLPADLGAIYDIAERHNLAVIEDAAHAFPAQWNGAYIGAGGRRNLPAAVCFSFYATKTITTGEGGMICTNDAGLADYCRMMSLHGISKDAWGRYTETGSWYYEIIAPGYKYNMTDIAAGIGLAQLRKAEEMRQRRSQIAMCYNAAFCQVPQLRIPVEHQDSQHAWHLYMLRLNLPKLRINRAQFIEALRALNIGTSVHFIPLHIHPYYQRTYGHRELDFPVAFKQYKRVISLPIYSRMSDDDVDDVIAAVLQVVYESARDPSVASEMSAQI
jgi:dTDP-4-amino-4,6-dideoxygalactose transaminase